MRSHHFLQSVTTLGLATVLMLFTSCSDDEPTAEESFRFDINDYNIDGGLIFDYGAVDYINYENPTHYNYDFAVFDGSYDMSGDAFEGSFLMIAELLSPGTTAFQAGTFNYVFPDDVEEVFGEFYFNSAAFVVDGNNNNSILETPSDETEDIMYLATSGTIVASDNGNDNYTLDFNLSLSQVDLRTEELISGTEIDVNLSVSVDFEIIEVFAGGRQVNNKLRLNKR
ncbi:MAG: hypothetical protein R8G66_02090 [Cytophagales bacterium]|nr:hypothetical protein [Cytophagales bacterium]